MQGLFFVEIMNKIRKVLSIKNIILLGITAFLIIPLYRVKPSYPKDGFTSLRPRLILNQLNTESSARELFEGLNPSEEESRAIAAQYSHLEKRFMLPVKGEMVTGSINPALLGLSFAELEDMANRFVVGPGMSHEAVAAKSDRVYPCFQVYSHARKPYFILPGDGVLIEFPNGKKKRIRYIGYLGGGLVLSKQERDRRRYTDDSFYFPDDKDRETPLTGETFGIEPIDGVSVNFGLEVAKLAEHRFAILRELCNKGETEVPLFLMISKLTTLRDARGSENTVPDLKKTGRILPAFTPAVALIGYEGLETMRDLDLMSQINLRISVERNKRQAQEKEGRRQPFSDKEFLLWFSERLGTRLTRLINHGIWRGNVSPQNMTFFEITDFDTVIKIKDYENKDNWNSVLFKHFFQGYVSLLFTFDLFCEKLGVDKDIAHDFKELYLRSILRGLNEKEREALIKTIFRNEHIDEGQAAKYIKICRGEADYSMLHEFVTGVADLLKVPSNPYRLFASGQHRGDTAIDENTVVFMDGGGDCAGLNSGKASLIPGLYESGLKAVGVQHGYNGMVSDEIEDKKVELTPAVANSMRKLPSTILGSCRRKLSPEDVDLILDRFQHAKAIVITGGNDHIKEAEKISLRAKERGIEILVICMPKSIDNDFKTAMQGFMSAVSFFSNSSQRASSAYRENTVGVLEVMGRKSGSLTFEYARYCNGPRATLVPEKPFTIQDIIDCVNRGVTTFVVSEGVSLSKEDPKLQELLEAFPVLRAMYEGAKDLDVHGNPKLTGASLFIKGILDHFCGLNVERTDLTFQGRGAPVGNFDIALTGYYAKAAERIIKTEKSGFFVLTYLGYEDKGPDAVEVKTVGKEVYSSRNLTDLYDDEQLRSSGVLGVDSASNIDFNMETITPERSQGTLEEEVAKNFFSIAISTRTHGPDASCVELREPSEVIVSACGREIDVSGISPEIETVVDATRESVLILIPENHVGFQDIAERVMEIYKREGYVNVAIKHDFPLNRKDRLLNEVLAKDPALKAKFDTEAIEDTEDDLVRFDSGVSLFINGLFKHLGIKPRVTNLGYAFKGLKKESSPDILNHKDILVRQGVIIWPRLKGVSLPRRRSHDLGL